MDQYFASFFPKINSTYGGEIDHLFWMIYYITGVWFIATELAIVYALIRYRKRPGHKATYTTGETRREIGWLLAPVLVVLVLDFYIDEAGVEVWNKIKIDIPEAAVQVKVTGKQFNWEMTYPGPDAQFDTPDDVTIDNDLYVPVNKNVRILLESKDVLHSFFLPTVRLKQDAVPGRRYTLWFNATEAGTNEIACAELCGFGHYTMRGRLIVKSDEDYQKWVDEQWKPKG
jgi:cytochrome c oxidase subunit II